MDRGLRDIGNLSLGDQEDMRSRIERVTEDLKDINLFYNIEYSGVRKARLQTFLSQSLEELKEAPFNSFDQQNRIDYLLLKNYLSRQLDQLDLDVAKDKTSALLLPFGPTILKLCEDRQQMKPIDGKKAAQDVFEIGKQIMAMKGKVERKEVKISKTSAFRASNTVEKLQSHLAEWYGYYNRYDPLFTWWLAEPYAKVAVELAQYAASIKEGLVGIKPEEKDAIVGDPIGRDGLLKDLEAEKIPYTPEELLKIGELEYEWCEKEMIKASQELGFGQDWKRALEYVKDLYVEPGKQPQLVLDLATEATEYVKKHDLITVPPVCEETWRMFMMSPEAQKVNPFFLGGDSIIVSYPTDSMPHEQKLMSMRGNNISFSRSTVFHELIPGHHLQLYMNARYRPYRQIFETPFSIEGWSLYWEMILWDDERFVKSPENRIGMLFWRMHRCARIIFSVKFHLGQMTPQECIDLLVDWVGHERATAEGEVRRSFAGDYSPLYQAGYMIGALQLYSLRQELVVSGIMSEKEFHDRIMKENQMPVEFMRALIKNLPLKPDFKSTWRFYKNLE
ncbi:Xaa-Pro dipeptidyl-peptidase [Coleophoma cylindrospora]|uniref:Xaa-Pro dipeptidyl-peptidase n=1 Tax=Coleophoma cylindrospora TaxID=1849047 RepID=A0A3D8Q8D7_9HELO|nr:Xaa-Pro dipeptidyl-peptidase [Coleophoma cylindrospora]